MAGPGTSSCGNSGETRWRALMEGVRKRDAESLARLYDETSRFLFGLALRILRDPADAEEVILDVYQHVWNHAELYDETRGNVWNWLAVVTRHRAIDRLRQANTRRSRESPIDPVEEQSAPDRAAQDGLIVQEEREMVRRALDSLTPDQRHAIDLAFFSGLTHVEIAERLGAPLGTTKTRIRAGLRRLREAMQAAVPIHAEVDAD